MVLYIDSKNLKTLNYITLNNNFIIGKKEWDLTNYIKLLVFKYI